MRGDPRPLFWAQVGTNYDEEESVLDVLYGPPEQYVSFESNKAAQLLPLFKLAWAKHKPDLFDSFSAGLVLLQMAVPYCRPLDRLRKLRSALDKNGGDLQAWRDDLPGVAQADFELADAEGGRLWALLKRLLAPRAKRATVAEALRDAALKPTPGATTSALKAVGAAAR